MAIKLQFAFQGGGAKLAALLAVAEVIQEFAARGKIEITQLAGTSAGAIVAAFVAAGISAEAVMAELKGGKGAQLMAGLSTPHKMSAAYRLLVKKERLWDSTQLREWLNGKFAQKKLVKIEDFARGGISLLVTKTDLGSRATVLAYPVEVIADALVDSCGLPYLFRIWSKDNGATMVDGGIANNLPAKLLAVADPAYGEMVAITFAEAATGHPKDFLSFSVSLLDSAMSATMALTREMFKDSLIEVQTSLTTFDFRRALSTEFELEYARIKETAARDLQAHLDRIAAGQRRAVTNPWTETNPTAVRLLRDVGELYYKLRGGLLRYDSCRLTVYTNAGRPMGDPHGSAQDKVQFHLKIHTGAEPLHCMSVGLVEQSDESSFASETAKCVVTGPAGERPEFLQIAMKRRADEASTGDRELCLFFTPPLLACTGPYTIEFQEDGKDLMIDLFDKKHDALGFFPQRADGPVGRIELVLFAHQDLNVLLKADDPARPGRDMTAAEIAVLTPIPMYPHMKAWGMSIDNAASDWNVLVHRLP